eukprot:5601710-Amphidinium_carterae.1
MWPSKTNHGKKLRGFAVNGMSNMSRILFDSKAQINQMSYVGTFGQSGTKGLNLTLSDMEPMSTKVDDRLSLWLTP